MNLKFKIYHFDKVDTTSLHLPSLLFSLKGASGNFNIFSFQYIPSPIIHVYQTQYVVNTYRHVVGLLIHMKKKHENAFSAQR